MFGFNTFSFFRFVKRPPSKGPPPKNFIDVAYSPDSGKIAAIDSDGNPVYFDSNGGSGTVTTDSLVTEPSNGSATAGKLGEYASLLIPLADEQFLTSGVAGGLSLSLTAGDWDVEGHITFDESAATVTARSAGVSTIAAVPADGSEVYDDRATTTITQKVSLQVPRKRISLAATTTVHLVCEATYSVGGIDIFGAMSARRVR